MRIPLHAGRTVEIENLQHESHRVDQHVCKSGDADVVDLRRGRLDVDRTVLSNGLFDVRLELVWVGLEPR